MVELGCAAALVVAEVSRGVMEWGGPGGTPVGNGDRDAVRDRQGVMSPGRGWRFVSAPVRLVLLSGGQCYEALVTACWNLPLWRYSRLSILL
jgi:hypothetical protein